VFVASLDRLHDVIRGLQPDELQQLDVDPVLVCREHAMRVRLGPASPLLLSPTLPAPEIPKTKQLKLEIAEQWSAPQ
jgi:hypothetical protein